MYAVHGQNRSTQNFRAWCMELKEHIKKSKLHSKTSASFLKKISQKYTITDEEKLLKIYWDEK